MCVCFLTYILFIFIIKLSSTHLTIDPKECKTWIKEHIFIIENTSTVILPKAVLTSNEFIDLNVSCNQNTTSFNVAQLFLFQTREILIDNNVDLRNILSLFRFSPRPNIVLHKLKGFNQVPSETRLINSQFENYIIMYTYSNFEFYKNRTLVSPKDCSYTNFNPKMASFFGSMEAIYFTFYTFYTHPVCPYVFMNSRLKFVQFDGISNSLIFVNRLEFVDINETQSLHTQSLQYVAFSFIFGQVTHTILNRLVFKQAYILVMQGIIDSLQPDLF